MLELKVYFLKQSSKAKNKNKSNKVREKAFKKGKKNKLFFLDFIFQLIMRQVDNKSIKE
jgi:hypothetical protein